MCGSWSIEWCISRWFNWTIANYPPFVLDIDVSTEMGLVVVADLDLNQFSIVLELWYDVMIEVLEVLIQFSIIILQCHIYNDKAQLIIYQPFHLSVFERESDAITLFHKYILIRDNVFLSKCILDGREDLVTFFQYMTLRFLETSIQFYCLVVGMVTCCVKVVLESLLQLKVVVHAVEQKSVADLRVGVSPWTSGQVNEV